MVNPAIDFPDFTKGVLLLGVDASGDQVGVLLDSDGNLNCILKGQGATGLQTIAVDENGRIQAFILEQESQWGQVLRVGAADLAGRLGSPVTWDWRGNVLYLHDFSLGLGCIQTATSGTGAAIAIDPTYAGFGGYALKMTGGSDASKFARFQLSVGTNPCARIGVALRFSITPTTDKVEVMLEKMIGAGSPWSYSRVDVANSKLQVMDSGYAWQDASAVDVPTAAFTFCWLKVVIDVDNGKYERVLFNDVEVDVSTVSYPTIVSATVGSILIQVTNYSRTGNNDIVYVDEVILSVNEPENS